MTKKNFSDMILYKLAGGVPDSSFPVDERDIWDALEHKVNEKFAMSQFQMNLPSGETIPDNLSLATYEDIAVTSISNYSKATLPVVPIYLPRNAGINEIRPILSKRGTDRVYGNPMIPLLAGQNYLLQADSLLNDLQGQFGYEVNGKTVNFTKDITTFGIDTVTIKMVVFDMSQYGLTDDMPIPANYIEEFESAMILEFAPVLAESGIVNNWTSVGQTAPNNAVQPVNKP
jgi:hypothetical protein